MITRSASRICQLLCLMFCMAGTVSAVAGEQSDPVGSEKKLIDEDEINRIVALSNDIEYGEYLAGECASCHLPTAVDTSDVPVIRGAKPAYLVRALLEFRAGIRTNTTMGSVANALSDEELSAIVHYLATP